MDHTPDRTASQDSTQRQGRVTKPPRGRYDATVRVNRPICREHHLLRVHVPTGLPASRPGQFIQLGCRPPYTGSGTQSLLGRAYDWQPGQPLVLAQPEMRQPMALLRRPFSIAGRGDDDDGTWIDVIHRVVGVGTSWLAGLTPGDRVDLIGPLGNWFTLPQDRCVGLMVGGGVGLPPMFYLSQALHRAGWSAVGFVGALTGDLLAVTFVDGVEPDSEGVPVASVQQYARYGFDAVVTTDDGTVGLHGRVTDGLQRYLRSQPEGRAKQTVIYTCGPNPMMRAVAQLAARFGIDCKVCLEQAMACGMGTCQSCVVKIEDSQGLAQGTTGCGTPWRYRLACADGPVFPASAVVWSP